MKILQDKTVIITGATRGIGKGIAELFADSGANVIFTYASSEEKAKAIEKDLKGRGVEAIAVKSNAADYHACEELVALALDKFETIDVVINNAGITRDGLLMRMTEENWDEGINNTGVMGLRGEVSMLKGSKDSEAGPYFGVGIGDDGPGLILGYDYRKYTGQRSGSPKKLGAQFEVNLGEAGAAFHLRPSITSTTKRGRPFYGGVHGLLAFGNLMDVFEWEPFDSSGNY